MKVFARRSSAGLMFVQQFRRTALRPREFPPNEIKFLAVIFGQWGAVLCSVFALGLMAPALKAQFAVTTLGTGVDNSIAYGQGGGQQVGIDSGAVVWTGSNASEVSLNPAGAYSSTAFATNGTQQGGSANFVNANFNDHAALWSGTAASFVDLQPAGASYSYVQALSATQQGGQAFFSGLGYAALWSGSAASFQNLNPAGASQSGIAAMSAALQGGYAVIGGEQHAVLWSGTASSFQDLNPAGADLSVINGMSGTQQGGAAYFSSVPHAGLWSGTAGSFVDLDPGQPAGSVINAMAGAFQAGTVLGSGGTIHAGLWEGTAGSFIDLQADITAALGSQYTWSSLFGADIDGSTLYLVGEAIDPIDQTSIAILVATPIPEPANGAGLTGLGVLGFAAWLRRCRQKGDRLEAESS